MLVSALQARAQRSAEKDGDELDRLYKCSNGLQVRRMTEGVYWVIMRQWLDNWRNYVTSNSDRCMSVTAGVGCPRG